MTMTAYVIASIEVTDPETYDDYRKGVAATITQHGGRFLARGGGVEHLEGSFIPKRVAILEFPSMTAARTWYASSEYAPLLALRKRASKGDLFMTEGV
jgi:uncharacterized protein (DUF1330 family)